MLTADANLEIRFAAKAGPRIVSVSFGRDLSEAEGVLQPRQSGFPLAADERYYGNAAVESVAISGPHASSGAGDTPSRRAIFVCRPDGVATEERCARRILSDLARRAYRRPVSAADVATLHGFYQDGRAAGGSFDAGIQLAVERLLVDPDFLFRVERDPAGVAPGTPYRVSDIVLASRLSFFLWNSIPDDEMLTLAVRGELRKPQVLERVVKRMLADERATSLVSNFAAQWLNLRNLDDVLPDPDRFPDFGENLRRDLRRETELFIGSTLRDDRSVIDLVAANYTFVNERVAKHYGIPNVYGTQFRRVTFAPGQPRGGLLGQGSILTVSSHPTRTSPVLRGKWVLQNLLGTIPPEPPPDVPALPEPADGAEPATTRALLERHRASAACASCHAPIDPLGIALENFDPIGRWRSTDGGAAIDASAAMPGGEPFAGPDGLRHLLLDRRDVFVGTVIEKLLAYAVGRGLEYYDRPAIRRILRESAAADHRWSAIILGIVKSPPFQMRRSWSEPATAVRN